MIPAVAVALLTVLAPIAPIHGPGPAEEIATPGESACAPPCGEINPRLIFDFEGLDRTPLELEQGDTVTFDGTITFWTDTDDETHSPSDPNEPIVISFSFPRLPDWAEMSVEPGEIPVDTACPTCFKTEGDDPTQPKAHYAFAQGITVTLEVVGEPERTTGYDYGKLQLFAKSTESGIYNPGYGIKEIRVGAGPGEQLESNSLADVPGPGVLLAAGVLGVVATALAVHRRRAD